MIERRKFLKALLAVPIAPVVLKGMDWATLTPTEAAAQGRAAYSALVPSGTILPFAGTEAPPGFLPCDGRAVPRELYPKLYEAIGEAYGTAPPRWRFWKRFRVPDLRGRVRHPAAIALDKKLKEAKNPNPIYDRPNFQYVIKS